MTTPNDVYAALCQRFGSDAVDAKLLEYDCRMVNYDRGPSRLNIWFEGDGWCVLPDPVALAVLCEVGEALLWEDGLLVSRVDYGDGYKWMWQDCNDATRFGYLDTRAAAIVAACGGTNA